MGRSPLEEMEDAESPELGAYVLVVLISHQGEALSPEQLIDLAAEPTGVGWLATG